MLPRTDVDCRFGLIGRVAAALRRRLRGAGLTVTEFGSFQSGFAIPGASDLDLGLGGELLTDVLPGWARQGLATQLGVRHVGGQHLHHPPPAARPPPGAMQSALAAEEGERALTHRDLSRCPTPPSRRSFNRLPQRVSVLQLSRNARSWLLGVVAQALDESGCARRCLACAAGGEGAHLRGRTAQPPPGNHRRSSMPCPLARSSLRRQCISPYPPRRRLAGPRGCERLLSARVPILRFWPPEGFLVEVAVAEPLTFLKGDLLEQARAGRGGRTREVRTFFPGAAKRMAEQGGAASPDAQPITRAELAHL